jgi:hypothetical protein
VYGLDERRSAGGRRSGGQAEVDGTWRRSADLGEQLDDELDGWPLELSGGRTDLNGQGGARGRSDLGAAEVGGRWRSSEAGGGSEGRSDLGAVLGDAAGFTSPPSPTGSHIIRMRERGLLGSA